MSGFVDFQNEIYLGGLGGAVPELPVTAAGLEERAREVLDAEAFVYVAGSASAERTVAANRSAFDRCRIVPRMLRGTSGPGARDLSVEVLGTRLAAPVLTAPVGVLELLHKDGEVIVAGVTKGLGIGTVLSTAASSTIEDVGAAAGGWWYQLGDRADVLFDSGIRTGSDVLIALALGAKAVLYGPAVGVRSRHRRSRGGAARAAGVARGLRCRDGVVRMREPGRAGPLADRDNALSRDLWPSAARVAGTRAGASVRSVTASRAVFDEGAGRQGPPARRVCSIARPGDSGLAFPQFRRV